MLAESCIDIVIPTMWIPDSVPERIALYASHPLISKVVVIDNDQFAVSRKTAEHFPLNVEILVQSSNIFVNQAWNIGVQCCSAPFVCIANDDIVIDPRLFHQILSRLLFEQVVWRKLQDFFQILTLAHLQIYGQTYICNPSFF